MAKKASEAVAVFDRKFTSMAGFFKANGVARGYDMAFINDDFMPLFALWVVVYPKWLDKQLRTPTLTAEKNRLFREGKRLYAIGSKMIKANRQTTEEEFVMLEIPYKTGGSHQPKPPATTHPQIDVDTSEHSHLTLWWREQGAKFPNKPEGQNHIKIVWAKLAVPPTSRDQLTNEFIDTHNPHIIKFGEEETGELLFYSGCWVSNAGEEGPYSPIAFAVIP
jgi:hypothetical protein